MVRAKAAGPPPASPAPEPEEWEHWAAKLPAIEGSPMPNEEDDMGMREGLAATSGGWEEEDDDMEELLAHFRAEDAKSAAAGEGGRGAAAEGQGADGAGA